MYAATAGLVVVSLAIAAFAGPLSVVTGRVGDDLVTRDGYRVAVWGAPGECAGDGAAAAVGRTGPAPRARDRLADPGLGPAVGHLHAAVDRRRGGGGRRGDRRVPVPPAEAHLPVRPLRLLGLVAYLVYDMVVSGAEVSWQVLRYGPAARGAVFEVPLLSGSDRVVTVVANALSLSPGAMALQIDHAHGLWFVYALGPRDGAGVERSRRRTMDMQRRVLAALGTTEELATAERLLAERGR